MARIRVRLMRLQRRRGGNLELVIQELEQISQVRRCSNGCQLSPGSIFLGVNSVHLKSEK
jgi:hypothetical protein